MSTPTHSPMDAAVSAQALTIGYRTRTGERVICPNIDVAIAPGELVCLLGPNGVGKSTLMATLAGMLAPLAGSVRLGGDDLRQLPARDRARRLAIVTTERVEAYELTGRALVALGRYPHTGWFGRLVSEDEERIDAALRMADAESFRNRPVGELSDGERQRVMLARALAQAEDVLILDELTAFLDLPRRMETMRTLRELAHDTGRAILLSTHDLELALRSADRVWLLPAGGPLTTGCPESLVLSGALARAFEAPGITFDSFEGTFNLAGVEGRLAEVVGVPLQRRWTERALVRMGWRLSTEADVRIQVDAELRWQVLDGSRALTDGVGLEALLQFLGRGTAR